MDNAEKLKPYAGKLDYMLSTVPHEYDISVYANCVKPYGTFTQVGMPVNGELKINNFLLVANGGNFNASMIGGIPETQEVINYAISRVLLSPSSTCLYWKSRLETVPE